jgi:oxygen-independent coproporphyrinogen-3 oxidase
LRDRARAIEFVDRPATLSFGGGTPSRLGPRDIATLVQALAPRGEVSFEANPEDVDEPWLAGVLDAGIDRLSLGVQSLQEPVAKRLGRAHTVADAHDAIARVARSGVRTWSVDLIFAVPGQTLHDLDRDLSAVLDAGAPHVSVYGLTIEPGTAFARATARGSLVPVADEVWRDFYDHLVDRLTAAGLERYEVSNFARPGHRSEHNALYWSDAPYLGLGPSAHSYTPDGERWVAERDLAAWLPGLPVTRERPSPRAAATDLIVSALRSVDGVDRSRLRARTGLDVEERTERLLVEHRLLHDAKDRLALTHAGFPLCDAVATKLVESLTSVH